MRLHCTSAAGKASFLAAKAKARPGHGRLLGNLGRWELGGLFVLRLPSQRGQGLQKQTESRDRQRTEPLLNPNPDRLVQITVASAHRSSLRMPSRTASRMSEVRSGNSSLMSRLFIDAPRTVREWPYHRFHTAFTPLSPTFRCTFGPSARSEGRLCAGFRKAGAQQLLQSPLCRLTKDFRA